MVSIYLKSILLTIHEAALRVGMIVLPLHYYVPYPDLRKLRQRRHVWAKRSLLRGVDVDLDSQVQALRDLVLPHLAEYRDNYTYTEAVSKNAGPGYGPIEAQALHGVLRSLKPRRIIEVGSGVSTWCMLDAINRNECPSAITCIEPHPRAWLREGQVTLIDAPVQECELALFEQLSTDDLLFIDSSHCVTTGSDVVFLILEVLPRLQSGVIVHFHDIYLPYDYPRRADKSFFQWQETTLLHAFLIENRSIEVLFCMSFLHYDRPDVLREVFPGYQQAHSDDGLEPISAFGKRQGQFPSSLYLRVR